MADFRNLSMFFKACCRLCCLVFRLLREARKVVECESGRESDRDSVARVHERIFVSEKSVHFNKKFIVKKRKAQNYACSRIFKVFKLHVYESTTSYVSFCSCHSFLNVLRVPTCCLYLKPKFNR